jgi:hypothetical protein
MGSFADRHFFHFMTVWRVARYRFNAVVQQPLALPEYAGKTRLLSRPMTVVRTNTSPEFKGIKTRGLGSCCHPR